MPIISIPLTTEQRVHGIAALWSYYEGQAEVEQAIIMLAESLNIDAVEGEDYVSTAARVAGEILVLRVERELPFSVGLNGEHPVRLRRFATHDEAAAFVGTLEGVEDGRYYLDGPEEWTGGPEPAGDSALRD